MMHGVKPGCGEGGSGTYCCEQMTSAIVGDEALCSCDLPIQYTPYFREYGLDYQDGGSSQQLIHYCPWCGHQFPTSLRNVWFERLETLGLELGDSRIPAEMFTSQWWEDEKL